jgi:hypothetical protein
MRHSLKSLRAFAGLAAIAALLFTVACPSAAHAARGNENKYAANWWGLRVWMNHANTQTTIRQEQATGRLSNWGSVQVPFPLSVAAKYVGCAGQFVQNLKRADVGYGVVFDAPWYTPFWTCGLSVWSQ